MSNNSNVPRDKRVALSNKISNLVNSDIKDQGNDNSSGQVTQFKASKDNLKTKDEHQERMKCSECGKSYLGQKNSSTCGDKCRQRKSRG